MRHPQRNPLADGLLSGDHERAGLENAPVRPTPELTRSSIRREFVSVGDNLRDIQNYKVFGRTLPRPNGPGSPAPPTVFVVDADATVRDHAEDLLQRSGWRSESFPSGQGFLAQRPAPGPRCLILELTLPDLCGLEVLRRMAADRFEMPVIIITDCNDLRRLALAMKAGVIELLPKPVDWEALLCAVGNALDLSRMALEQAAETRVLQARYASLSCREREVMALVTEGLLNKQVGGRLGISEITVKAHRGQVMRKMQARTLVDLVHMSAKLCAAFFPGAQDASPL